MVDPITWTAAAAIGSLAVGGVGAGVAYQGSLVQRAGIEAQAQATKTASDYAAKVAENNAIAAKQNADRAIQAGQQKAQTASLKNAQNVARVTAAMAANGVNTNTGSSVDVQEGQRKTGVLDAETVLNNAQLEAYGYRTQQSNYESEAKLDRFRGDSALVGAGIASEGVGTAADASLLSSASSLGFKWSTSGTKTGTDTGIPGYGTAGNDPLKEFST